MIQAIGAAQLEFHPGRRELSPPARQALQYSGYSSQTEGDAGGHRPLTVQPPEAPERLAEALRPPIPKRQIHGTACWWAETRQQRIELLRSRRVQSLQPGEHGQQVPLHLDQGESAMPRFKPPGFTATDAAVPGQAQLQAHHRCRRAAADGEGHVLGERKTPQGPGHGQQLQSPNCHNTAVAQTETA